MLGPYQIFFPLGVLYSIWGAVVWVLFALGKLTYPGNFHAQIMMGGFLFSFALGFLMTAVPQFLGTEEASKGEIGTTLLLSLFMGLSPLHERGLALRPLVGVCTLAFLAFFFARRFRKRSANPPAEFLFIPLGLIFGMVGGALLTLADSGMLGLSAHSAGRALLFQGTMLCLTLGVGGKLVTAILGWSTAPLISIEGISKSRVNPIRVLMALPVFWLALGMTVGFMLEFAGLETFGRVLRALVASVIAFQKWKLHRLPAERSTLTFSIWLSCWFLVIGVWAYAVVPNYGVHGLHLLFIGGFALMSLFIATRVSIAHGDHDFALEERSWPLRITTFLILLAAIVRATANWVPSYIYHLGYAAAVWIAAVSVWSAFFLRIVLRHAAPESPEKSSP